jgi:tRNA(adenine34) deaminase
MKDPCSEHERYMQMALDQAAAAAANGEVPVGAVLIDQDGKVLAYGANETIKTCDPTAHAEIVCLRRAAVICSNYRLLSTTLYVTVEPCVMCMGALIHARVARIVYGAPDPKWGAAGSLYDFAVDSRFNHHPEIIAGICMEQCRFMIQTFFQKKRS